jgi:hypothetical protein
MFRHVIFSCGLTNAPVRQNLGTPREQRAITRLGGSRAQPRAPCCPGQVRRARAAPRRAACPTRRALGLSDTGLWPRHPARAAGRSRAPYGRPPRRRLSGAGPGHRCAHAHQGQRALMPTQGALPGAMGDQSCAQAAPWLPGHGVRVVPRGLSGREWGAKGGACVPHHESLAGLAHAVHRPNSVQRRPGPSDEPRPRALCGSARPAHAPRAGHSPRGSPRAVHKEVRDILYRIP